MFGSIVKSIFGDKAKRDLKEVQPLVEQVKAEYAKLANLSHN